MMKRIVISVLLVAIAISLFFLLKREETPAPQPQRDESRAKSVIQEIRTKQTNTGLRVMLFGWDAGDWQMILPLLNENRLPNLKKLLENGVRANLRSYSPMFSPLLWTSIATGKKPGDHGIVDFLVVDPATNRSVPINSTFRKSMALWNMLSEAGKTSAFIAWWATWPGEAINGVMVTDRVSYSLFSNVASETPAERLTHPEEYYSQVKPKLISEKDISNERLAQFVNLKPAEIAEERVRKYPEGKTNPVSYLAEVIASTENYHKIAIDLLKKGKYDLFSVYFEGTDQVSHLFQHCMPPRMSLATDEEFRRYKDVIPRFYEYVDRLTGELMQYATKETVVMIVSDHGFKNGAERPTDFPPYINEKPGYWHREYGIFVAAGGPVQRHASIDTVQLFDIAPTILYLLGLPIGQDMPGKVLTSALQPEFQSKLSVQKVNSWEPLRQEVPQTRTASSRVDEETMENLAALGYIGDVEKGGGVATASYYRNLADVYLREGKFEEAEKYLKQSLAMGASFASYDLLYELRVKQNRKEEAATAIKDGILRTDDPPGEAYIKLTEIYLDLNKGDELNTLLKQFSRKIPAEKFRLHLQGMMLQKEGKLREAESSYRAALEQDPAFIYSMDRLYQIYRTTGEMEKLEDIARKGLKANRSLAVYHNILGVIHKRKGRYQEAIEEYSQALESEPDNPVYLANLGAALLSMGRADGALEVLTRARDKNERDPEIWLNLGAVYGRLGRSQEALSAFEKAEELGGRSPNIDMGKAIVYAENRDLNSAIRLLESAVVEYPQNQDLRELLEMMKQERSAR